jgi:ADP-L-glycero-D-manno-heptose 6-epimerase
LNLDYSKSLWKLCAEKGIPFLYASSAATYGDGSQGFKDDESSLEHLEPLNPYGQSKQDFDVWVMHQSQTPPQWSGFKFFNVYGPNEYHKNRMASVILHAFRQIQSSGAMKLFRSHHPDFKDGHQSRDFIYVKDVVHMLHWFWKQQVPNGIYNVGTGKARTFLDLTRATFKAMDQEENISFIDTPKDIRDKYQYFTEADMEKVRSVGYQHEFTSLEKGVEDYVRQYLMEERYF